MDGFSSTPIRIIFITDYSVTMVQLVMPSDANCFLILSTVAELQPTILMVVRELQPENM